MDQLGNQGNDSHRAILQQRVGELEQRVAELESEIQQAREASGHRINWRQQGGPLLILAATLLLALTPSALVFLDRWLGKHAVTNLVRNLWCQVRPLCDSAFPSYFAVVLVCIVAVFAFVWIARSSRLVSAEPRTDKVNAGAGQAAIGRRQARVARILVLGGMAVLLLLCVWTVIKRSVPGWGYAFAFVAFPLGWVLRSVSVAQVAAGWQKNRRWLIAFLLMAGALVAVLASLYGALHFQWFYAALLAVALANLWPHYRSVPPILWVMTLALILYTANLNAWWLSGIGDEYEFFYRARYIVEVQKLPAIGALLFNGQGAYGTHPFFSSLIQAAFMKLLGVDGFGWRFSNMFLSALSLGFLYAFFRLFVPKRTAIIGTLLLAASHYIMSFGKIGYNNLQALFAMALALWAAAWAVRSARPLAYVALGGALGLCFYVYPAALYALPIPLLLLLLYAPPFTRRAAHCWAMMALTLSFLVLPLTIQPEYWRTKIFGTFFFKPQLVQTGGNLLAHLSRNMAYALFSFLYVPEEGHFVAASYVDPLTGALVLLGLACLLKLLPWRGRRAPVFLLSSFIAIVFLAGATHDRAFPPSTRMFMVLPWLALFAAIGLAWVADQLQRIQLGNIDGRGLAWTILVAVLALNLYQAYPLARDRMAGLQSMETLVFRMIQRAQREEAMEPKTYIFITDPTWTSLGIAQIPKIHPLRAQVADVIVQEPSLPEYTKRQLAERNSLVIIKPWLDPSWQEALAPALRELGKEPCEVKATTGDVRFTLWHAPGLEWLCQ